jgi:protoporphyrinogen/coproporphyrinogen III oxidase
VTYAIDVAIVGGGIAGLAAAWELQQCGVAAWVLEGSARAGGVIHTERFDGWTVDAGPDSLLVQKPAAVSLCRELGIADRLHPTLMPRTAYVLRDGRLHPLLEGSALGFPIRLMPLARSTLFTPAAKMRMGLEAVLPRRAAAASAASATIDESIASFVRRRFGEEAVDYLAEPLLAGIHAGDVERLSMKALFPRLLEVERTHGSVIRGFRALHVTASSQGAFVSLPGGLSELVEALAAALVPGTIRVTARALELRWANGFAIEVPGGTVQARAVILAVPAYAAAALLRGIDTTLAGLCETIPYASTATVAFGYRREHIGHALHGSGFVVPRVERRPLLAATWVSSKWPGRAPEGHVLLRAFLGGGRDPHRLDRPDAELRDTAREELADILQINGEPVFEPRVYRWTRQSPQYEVGHLDRVAAIERRLSSVPGLFVAGSGFRAIGIPDCVQDGRTQAARAAQFVAGPARAGPSR